MEITPKQVKRLMTFTGTKIQRNPLTKKYYWATYGFYEGMYTSDGFEYNSRKEAIKNFLLHAIGEVPSVRDTGQSIQGTYKAPKKRC